MATKYSTLPDYMTPDEFDDVRKAFFAALTADPEGIADAWGCDVEDLTGSDVPDDDIAEFLDIEIVDERDAAREIAADMVLSELAERRGLRY